MHVGRNYVNLESNDEFFFFPCFLFRFKVLLPVFQAAHKHMLACVKILMSMHSGPSALLA